MSTSHPVVTKGTRALGAAFALAGGTALLITAAMNKSFGVSQAATSEGQQLLGTAAIVIDVAGLVLFGLATGALAARGKKVAAFMTGTVMLLCALFSIASIMGFVASERLSLSKSREDKIKSKQAQEVSRELAAKETRDRQAALAEKHLKWLQGTTRESGGRRERKDMLEAANKTISSLTKPEEAPAKVPEDLTVAMRPDGQAELLSEMTGFSMAGVQISIVAYLSVLLIVIKGFSFPLAAFFWSAPKMSKVIELREGEGYKLASSDGPLAEVSIIGPPKMIENKGSNNGLDPVPAAVSSEIHPTILARLARPPMPEAIPALQGFGYPLAGKPKGELRKVFSSPKGAAQNFVTWLQAYDLVGTYSPDELIQLYKEFARRDHREQTADNFLRDALSRLGKRNGIERLDSWKGERKRRWVVHAGKFAKGGTKAPAVAASAETQPEAPSGALDQQSAKVVRFRPFGGAPAEWGHNAVALVRLQKAEWQRRASAREKKQTNRFSRARGAA